MWGVEEGREKEEMMMLGRWYSLWSERRRVRRVGREVIFWLASVLGRESQQESVSICERRCLSREERDDVLCLELVRGDDGRQREQRPVDGDHTLGDIECSVVTEDSWIDRPKVVNMSVKGDSIAREMIEVHSRSRT